MGYAINELLTHLTERGLTFGRTPSGELEVIGDTGRLTDAIRQGISEHRQTILACLPAAPSEPPKVLAANDIRRQLDDFGRWLRQFACWAQPRYLDSIDKRLAEAVDTQNSQTVAEQIEALRQEIDGINWAAEILPYTYQVEAKHDAEAGAGPAGNSAVADSVPF